MASKHERDRIGNLGGHHQSPLDSSWSAGPGIGIPGALRFLGPTRLHRGPTEARARPSIILPHLRRRVRVRIRSILLLSAGLDFGSLGLTLVSFPAVKRNAVYVLAHSLGGILPDGSLEGSDTRQRGGGGRPHCCVVLKWTPADVDLSVGSQEQP